MSSTQNGRGFRYTQLFGIIRQQMRAASMVPSFNGINVCSIARTVLGKVVTITRTFQLAGLQKNRQPLLSVNDSSCNHSTVQCNPTQARQIDIPVMLPDSEP
jgi:hypothetical protein